MIVLAVDSTTDRLAVAAGVPGGVAARRFAEGARRHAALLVGLTREVLAEAGADRPDALAIADGPGSFTGLRVAAAWAKGLARVRPLPVYSASTLLVRAMTGRDLGATRVLAVGSALRGELYAAGYRFDGDSVRTVVAPTVLAAGAPVPGFDPEVVVADLPAGTLGGWPFGSARIIEPPAGRPDAAHLIGLVGLTGGAGQVVDLSHWEPQYGRPAEAQAKWEREHGRALPDSAGRRG